ncbi:hypothetical protein KIW84_065576 [Lathyrus oleraceus]|uniref:Uncharacterized protein n=1 Tax=Pisum sativum TaxID=3888 RepID=A0A9D4WFI8_PEA|nr:hypothetical protein KIW84_065576 [Pisum sativum]
MLFVPKWWKPKPKTASEVGFKTASHSSSSNGEALQTTGKEKEGDTINNQVGYHPSPATQSSAANFVPSNAQVPKTPPRGINKRDIGSCFFVWHFCWSSVCTGSCRNILKAIPSAGIFREPMTQVNGTTLVVQSPSSHDLQIYGIVVTIVLCFMVFGGVKMINRVAPAFLIPVLFSFVALNSACLKGEINVEALEGLVARSPNLKSLSDADVLPAMDDGIHDGVDILYLSLGPNPPHRLAGIRRLCEDYKNESRTNQ